MPVRPPPPHRDTTMSDFTAPNFDSEADTTPLRPGQLSPNGQWIFGSIFAGLVLVGFGFGVWAGAPKSKPEVAEVKKEPEKPAPPPAPKPTPAPAPVVTPPVVPPAPVDPMPPVEPEPKPKEPEPKPKEKEPEHKPKEPEPK